MITRSLLAPVEHVWSQDPALDATDTQRLDDALAEARKTGSITGLPLREGERPSVFVLRRLSRAAWLRIGRMPSGFEQDSETVALGLVDLRDYTVDRVPVRVELADGGDGLKRVKNDTLDAIYDPFLFRELAERVLEVSRLDPLRASG
jgi:hypothetical protein